MVAASRGDGSSGSAASSLSLWPPRGTRYTAHATAIASATAAGSGPLMPATAAARKEEQGKE